MDPAHSTRQEQSTDLEHTGLEQSTEQEQSMDQEHRKYPERRNQRQPLLHRGERSN